jgi:predicted transcriptional regulator
VGRGVRTAASLLEHRARSRLARLVASDPGIHFKELARLSGLSNGALVHHMRRLVEAGVLVVERHGRYKCYFAEGAAVNRANAGVTRAKGARAVLQCVKDNPGSSMRETADLCKVHPSTVTYHARRLARAGVIVMVRRGPFQLLFPSEATGAPGLFIRGSGKAACRAGGDGA